MDSSNLQRLVGVSREKFDQFVGILERMGQSDTPFRYAGQGHISLRKKALLFLWYMSTSDSFREIARKFRLSQSAAYQTVERVLKDVSHHSSNFVAWMNANEKSRNAERFHAETGFRNVVGAIDGCQIRILRPPQEGDNYLNVKGFYSILLQAVCDSQGNFVDIFVGPPGCMNDATMLRMSPLYHLWQEKLGNRWKLLGDAAYVSPDFPFVVTPKQDDGYATELDVALNAAALSRGRDILNGAFGRLKCRFQRLRNVQNATLENAVRIVIAGCVLHNFTQSLSNCDKHPNGCPREDDGNDE